MSHLGYYDPEVDSTPLQQVECFPAGEAKRKAHRAFKRGMFLGAAAMAAGIFAADRAAGETISIGRAYIHGEAFGSTTVTIAPSTEPGEWARVVLVNKHVNQGSDTGNYTLTLDGVVIGVAFEWDKIALTGADAITLTPPAGITCLPADCSVTVMEGFEGEIILIDFMGF
jgi:hypothetical protein